MEFVARVSYSTIKHDGNTVVYINWKNGHAMSASSSRYIRWLRDCFTIHGILLTETGVIFRVRMTASYERPWDLVDEFFECLGVDWVVDLTDD